MTRLCTLALVLFSGSALSQSAPPVDDLASAGQAFLAALQDWRAGDDAAGGPLREAGQRMAALGRPDAVDVASFYLELDREARLRGQAREAEYLSLRAELSEAEGLDIERWRPLRKRLITDLEALGTAVATEPDFTPSARAHALAARILVSQATADELLVDAPREAVLARIAEHAQRSLELFGQAGQLTPQLEPRWVLAELARAKLLDGQADDAFAQCAELAQRLGRDEWRERALLGRVALARAAGDVAAVERLLMDLGSFRSPESCWPLVREEALTRYHADRPEEALGLLLDFPPADDRNRADWHALLASAYARAGRFDESALETAQLVALEGSGSERGLLSEARAARLAERPERVLELLGAPTTRAALSPEARAEAAALVGEAHLTLGAAEDARRVLDEALRLGDEWRSVARESGSVVGERIGLQTVVLAARAAAEAGDILGALLLLESQQAAGLRPVGEPLTRAELLDHAAQHASGLLSVTVGADDGLVVHLAADGSGSWARLPHGRAAVGRGVRRLREALLSGDESRWRRLAEELGNAFVPRAIRDRLRTGGGLQVLAHGPLEALPWSALMPGGELLDERVVLSLLPGLPPLNAEKYEASAHSNWNLFGAPPTHQHAPLVEARRELTHLGRTLHGAGLHTGGRATRDALLRALATPRPLHVATHLVDHAGCDGARLSPEGLLVAGDDVVCAAQLARTPIAAPLVVLLACRSGTGRLVDAEGLFGVGRALLEGGVRDLVVTLWPVEDRGARLFAERLHAHLAAGLDAATAACAARGDLRAEGLPPAAWAACRLLGQG